MQKNVLKPTAECKPTFSKMTCRAAWRPDFQNCLCPKTSCDPTVSDGPLVLLQNAEMPCLMGQREPEDEAKDKDCLVQRPDP